MNVQYLTKVEFIQKFEAFQWENLLKLQLSASDKQVQASPSLNIEDSDGKGISVSIVGELDNYEFYVCFKRPITRKKKKWFGFREYDFYDGDFCSVIPEQSKQDGLDAFLLFYDRDFEKLDKRW